MKPVHYLTAFTKRSLVTGGAHRINHILCKAEWNYFRVR